MHPVKHLPDHPFHLGLLLSIIDFRFLEMLFQIEVLILEIRVPLGYCQLHSMSHTPTDKIKETNLLALFSTACSLSFFFALNRAEASVLRLRLLLVVSDSSSYRIIKQPARRGLSKDRPA